MVGAIAFDVLIIPTDCVLTLLFDLFTDNWQTTKVRESNHFILVAGPPRAASTPSVLVYGAVLSTGLILLTCGGASRVYRGMNKVRIPSVFSRDLSN